MQRSPYNPFRSRLAAACCCLAAVLAVAADWPGWRGPDGNAVADGHPLPVRWSQTEHVRWSVELDGEGSSSPIVVGDRVYLTAAHELGRRREIVCLDRDTGRVEWRREIQDDDPEAASSLTGHAAATPVGDDTRVIAAFGRAGLVCWSAAGELLWRFDLGQFDSELGLASSPILVDGLAILVCDHDGDRFRSFDSYLLAVDVQTGRERWRTPRPGLYRSWSAPLALPGKDGGFRLLVHAQDGLRAYDGRTGKLQWQVPTDAGWVTPSPVQADGLAFVASGKNGPLMAIRPGDSVPAPRRVAWRHDRAGPYVCSPLVYRGRLYVHDESGILTCYDAPTGRREYRARLDGKFYASAVAGDGKLYFASEEGALHVVAAGPEFKRLASNELDSGCLASPALADRSLFIRTHTRLWRIDP